ncbi:MAG: Unknown protein [uncultured Campylobacterales bacterium]|uniref:DUF2603 domain-containing protein n=1 Tax=uncultured Campylobacterales bacterium TaxID=352960 RepID=A0A6S6S5R1_9BACT|nr:MAG: Unknown protein [uncultured Campylobacterales bacterium]
MSQEQQLSPEQRINALNYKFNLGDFSFFKMTESNGFKVLELRDGQPQNSDIWYTVDNDDQIKTIIPFDVFSIVLDDMRKLHKEIFELKLEKSIWKFLPKDFDDVYTVVSSKLSDNLDLSSDELDDILKDVKKEYSNLFIDMNDIVHA